MKEAQFFSGENPKDKKEAEKPKKEIKAFDWSEELVNTDEASGVERLEKGMDAGADALDKAAAMLDSLKDKDVSTFSEEKKEAVRKLIDRTRSFRHTMALVGIGFAINATHLESSPTRMVTKEKDEKGNLVYHHSDKRTEHILNVITGKEAFSDEENDVILHDWIIDEYKKDPFIFNTPQPDNLSDMTYQQELQFVKDYYTHQKELTSAWDDPGTKYDENTTERLDEWFVSTEGNQHIFFDEAAYNSLWQIEEENGAPLITWMSRHERIYPTDNVARAKFNSKMFTMSLPISSALNDSISEFAHAQQWNENPSAVDIQLQADWTKAEAEMLRTGKQIGIVQGEMYNIPGTVEYDAHSVREPKLKEVFEKKKRDYKLNKVELTDDADHDPNDPISPK